MEDDIRAQTDKAGFCREHYRQMFVYGNRLGSALIMETHLKKMSTELKKQMDHYSSGSKPSLVGRLRRTGGPGETEKNNVSAWISWQLGSCYICEQI